VRLRRRTLRWDDYVHLAFDELLLAGAGSPQVVRRLTHVLTDLRTVAPPERRLVLDRLLTQLRTEEGERDDLVVGTSRPA
jgi:hypothetical protein